jgi:hypothetical protein
MVSVGRQSHTWRTKAAGIIGDLKMRLFRQKRRFENEALRFA